MNRIRWAELMQIGIGQMGLSPQVFWDLTPAELLLLTGADMQGPAINRGGLEALMRAYPDKHNNNGGPDGRS